MKLAKTKFSVINFIAVSVFGNTQMNITGADTALMPYCCLVSFFFSRTLEQT